MPQGVTLPKLVLKVVATFCTQIATMDVTLFIGRIFILWGYSVLCWRRVSNNINSRPLTLFNLLYFVIRILICNSWSKGSNGLSTRTGPVSVSVSVTVKVYHCVNGNGPFDRQNGFCTHSVRQMDCLHRHNDKLWWWRRWTSILQLYATNLVYF